MSNFMSRVTNRRANADARNNNATVIENKYALTEEHITYFIPVELLNPALLPYLPEYGISTSKYRKHGSNFDITESVFEDDGLDKPLGPRLKNDQLFGKFYSFNSSPCFIKTKFKNLKFSVCEKHFFLRKQNSLRLNILVPLFNSLKPLISFSGMANAFIWKMNMNRVKPAALEQNVEINSDFSQLFIYSSKTIKIFSHFNCFLFTPNYPVLFLVHVYLPTLYTFVTKLPYFSGFGGEKVNSAAKGLKDSGLLWFTGLKHKTLQNINLNLFSCHCLLFSLPYKLQFGNLSQK